MPLSYKSLYLIFAALIGLSFHAQAETFVLVHGALFTSDGWSRLESILQDYENNVVSPNVPGRSGDGIDPRTVNLQMAVEKVCKVARATQQQVILVGHSQGGALITQATAVCPESIKALVYIAAVVPLSGKSAFDGLTGATFENFGKCATPDPDAGVFRLVTNRSVLEDRFLQDVRAQDPKLADLTVSTMVDEPLGIGGSTLNYSQAVYDSLPKFYIKTLRDQVVIPDDQLGYIKRTKMTKVFEMDTSHSPFLSQPRELAENLREIGALLR
jgi:pimeloyl-ACP methyl ester carboxylesterase